MKKSKNYYAGVGIGIGTGIAAAVCMSLFAITNNAIYIAFIGVGTIIGLIWGSSIDKTKNK